MRSYNRDDSDSSVTTCWFLLCARNWSSTCIRKLLRAVTESESDFTHSAVSFTNCHVDMIQQSVRIQQEHARQLYLYIGKPTLITPIWVADTAISPAVVSTLHWNLPFTCWRAQTPHGIALQSYALHDLTHSLFAWHDAAHTGRDPINTRYARPP